MLVPVDLYRLWSLQKLGERLHNWCDCHEGSQLIDEAVPRPDVRERVLLPPQVKPPLNELPSGNAGTSLGAE